MSAAVAQNGTDPAAERPAVLVVEDDVLIRLSIADGLRLEGFVVIEAANADEALTILQSGIPLDLVFTDVRMPGSIDGLGLVERTRTMRPNLRIFVTSGQPAHLSASRGADGVFAKPYDIDRVVQTFAALLQGETQ
jgi:CheY-like chemotaxis protein